MDLFFNVFHLLRFFSLVFVYDINGTMCILCTHLFGILPCLKCSFFKLIFHFSFLCLFLLSFVCSFFYHQRIWIRLHGSLQTMRWLEKIDIIGILIVNISSLFFSSLFSLLCNKTKKIMPSYAQALMNSNEKLKWSSSVLEGK